MKKFYFLIIPALLLTACAQGIRSLPGEINGNVGTSSQDARNLADARIGLSVATLMDSTAKNPERYGTTGLGALEIWLKNSALPGQGKQVWTRNDSRDGSTTARLMSGGSGSATNTATVQIPGAFFFEGNYYLNEDSLRQHPIGDADLAAMYYRRPDLRKQLLSGWGLEPETK